MPGLASTVGDRLPTNPEIRVRFPPLPKKMASFSRRGRINARPRFFRISFQQANRATPSTGEKWSSSLSLYERGAVP